jgi:drug/metabolite transporter (DMT)-like permease
MPRWLGVLLLLGLATCFGANHVAARLAFDNGLNVATAVTVRSVGTALAVLVLLRLSGVTLRMPAATLGRGLAIGLLVSIQSVCLYSAVSRIPVALALLVFNTFPIMLAVVSWLAGGERPARRTLIAMPIALLGLSIALGVANPSSARGAMSMGFAQMAPGLGFALAASAVFGLALYLMGRWLPSMDGRLRTLLFMSVVSVVSIVLGSLVTGFSWPANATGWLGLSLLTVFYGTAITGLFMVLPRIGTLNNAAIFNFEPVASLVLAWWVLGQTMSGMQLTGGAIVIGAIVYLSTGRR